MQMESIALFIAVLAIVLCFLYIYADGEHGVFEVGNSPFLCRMAQGENEFTEEIIDATS